MQRGAHDPAACDELQITQHELRSQRLGGLVRRLREQAVGGLSALRQRVDAGEHRPRQHRRHGEREQAGSGAVGVHGVLPFVVQLVVDG